MTFETRSTEDLKKVGAWVYASHPTTEVICLGFSINGGAPEIWRPDIHGAAIPLALAEALAGGAVLVAHNATFERAVWDTIMVPVFGWPSLPIEQLFDTMAACAYRALPLKLEKAAQILALPKQKGDVPKKYFHPARDGSFLEPGAELYEYCALDVETEVELLKAIKTLPPDELATYHLDQVINRRGVLIDTEYVRQSQLVVDRASAPLVKEFTKIVGFGPNQRDKVLGWVHAQGVDLPNMRKETLDEILGESEDAEDEIGGEITAEDLDRELGQDPLPEHVRRALSIRRVVGSASIKKLGKLLACAGPDSRARGLLQYHGTSTTGRWAGRLIQPQNFPRPTEAMKDVPVDVLVEAVLSGDPDVVEMMFGVPAIEAVMAGLRHAIIAAPGHLLTVGDFSMIEACVSMALAGQDDIVELLRNKGKIYEEMASKIYGYPVNKKDHPIERQVGKNAVLGLGYQMGWRKFIKQTKTQTGILLDPDLAQRTVTAYREDFAPALPKLWRGLEDASLAAVRDGRAHEAFGVRYKLREGWLTARLPSGAIIWYADPQVVSRPMPWDPDDIRLGWRFKAWKLGQWRPVDAYGGLLTENVTSHLARDLLVGAIKRAEKNNLPTVLTVHDEGVHEPLDKYADEAVLKAVMEDVDPWAREMRIPVSAECWTGERYRK